MIADVGQLLVDSLQRTIPGRATRVNHACHLQNRNQHPVARAVTTLAAGITAMLMLDDQLISQKKPGPSLDGTAVSWLRLSVNAARLCKVLQLADFKVTFTGCDGRYSQLFHSFCGKRKGAIELA